MADGSSSTSARRTSHVGPGNVPRRPSYASVVQGQPTSPDASVRSPPFSPISTSATGPNAPSYSPYNTTSTSRGRIILQDQSQVQESMDYRHRRGLSEGITAQPPYFADINFLKPLRIPEYLHNSRYARRLQTYYQARLRALRSYDEHATDDSMWSLTTSARFAPSHRGMTYDIVESNPPIENDLQPLPSQFSTMDKYPGLDLTADGFEVRYSGLTGKDLEAASIRADFPISPQCGIYYYEITIKAKNKDCAVAIGFSSGKSSLERLPGWEPESWAYHGDDGKAFSGVSQGAPYSKTFGVGDVVGCGIDFNRKCAFFTRNGLNMGPAFRDLSLPQGGVFPCVGMKKYSGVHIEANFGARPLVYDIATRVHEEEEAVTKSIHKKPTTSLHPGQTESSFTQDLVANFLAHAGYTETLRRFNNQVSNERRALQGEDKSAHDGQDNRTNTTGRSMIRSAILRGDIDAALRLVKAYFLPVYETDPNVQFQLECQKFIELVRQAADIRKDRDNHNGKQPAREHSSPSNSEQDQAMEVDDDAHLSNGSTNTSLRNSPENAEYDIKNIETLKYGAYLREEYTDRGDEYDRMLKEIFSLMPYTDPVSCPYAYLLGEARRRKIAKEINSAILSFDGHLPQPALETAVNQTEILIELLSRKGGPAAYVNLQRHEPAES